MSYTRCYPCFMNRSSRCKRCRNELVLGARHCHWCGTEQAGRLAGKGRKACPSCGEGVVSGASFCAWCGAGPAGPGMVLSDLEGWEFEWSCPSCGGAVVCTMKHCPSCGRRVALKLKKDERCRHCGGYFHPGWYFCAQCGGMLEPFLFLPAMKGKVRISPQALFLMCLAATERFHQGKGPKGKGKPLEALGLLLGKRGRNGYRVTHAYPLVAAEALPNSAHADPAHLGPVGKLDSLCGAGLQVLGTFHSHPNGPSTPSMRDRQVLHGGAFGMIVGVEPARGKHDWDFDLLRLGLVGGVGGLKFSVAAYLMGEDGVVRSLPVERG